MNFNQAPAAPTPKFTKEQLPKDVAAAHTKAKELFKSEQIDIRKVFSESHGDVTIERDLATVEKLKANFEFNETKAYAEILEGVMLEHIELSNWFGETASTIKTSEFDDIVNGSDMLVELEHIDGDVPSPLSLSVDVTFASGESLDKKLMKIRDHIKNGGELGRIKYYHSDGVDFQGELKRVPQVVIGVQKEIVRALGELWVARNNKALEKHPVQKVILEEIKLQLMHFRDYANKNDQKEAAAKFSLELAKVNSIIKQKPEISFEGIEDDRVFTAIKEKVQAIFA